MYIDRYVIRESVFQFEKSAFLQNWMIYFVDVCSSILTEICGLWMFCYKWKYVWKISGEERAYLLESSCFNAFERICNGTASSCKTNCHVLLTLYGRMVSNGHMESVFLSSSLMLTRSNFSNTLIITVVHLRVNSSIRTKPKTCQWRNGGLSLW